MSALLHPGLLRLVKLRLSATGRRMKSGLRTPKGAITTAVGVMVFILWLMPSVLIMLQGETRDPEMLRQLFPMLLLGLCTMTVLTSVGERAIYFNPAEVAFLFSGPFTRRELLIYKMLMSLVGITVSSLFFSIVMLRAGAPLHAVYPGVFCALLFAHLLSTIMLLAGQMIAERAYTRARKLAFTAVFILVTWAAYSAVSSGIEDGALNALRDMRQHPAMRYLLLPLVPFAELVTVERVFPDMLIWGGLGLAIDGVLFIALLGLDSEYRDSAVAISQKVSRRLAQVRRSGMMGMSERAGWTPPRLPWMAGAGPVAWRQFINVARNAKGLLMMLVFLGIAVGIPFMVKGGEMEGFWPFFSTTLIWVTIMLTMMLRFDFRADIEQMNWLKMLPLSGLGVCLGELIMPVAVCTLLQAAAIGAAAYMRQDPLMVPVCLAFAVPINVMLFAAENTLFLLFPTRQAVFSPGDFQMFGRQLLMMMAKMLLVGICVGLAVGLGALAFFLGAGYVISATLGWAVVMAGAAASLPFCAWAYNRFDVSDSVAE